MFILKSNAYHTFWLGRYFTRLQHLCDALPFQDDATALHFHMHFAYLLMMQALSMNYSMTLYSPFL